MKRVILPLGAVVAFSLSVAGFAAVQPSSTQLSTKVDQLTVQTQTLQSEVAQLRAELNKKKHHRHHHAKKEKIVTPPAEPVYPAPVAARYGRTAGPEKPWQHFVTVTTTPFTGKQADFDGDDLIFNYSSINEDLALLENRQGIENEMAAQGYKLDRPILQLSGGVEGQFYSTSGFGTSATDGMNLSDAQVDMNAIASSWASAFMTFNVSGSPISTGNREPNTTVYVGRGFVTIGNLDVTPIYFTGGLMYVPFGRYSNDMITTPLTASLFKTRTPAALLGFKLNNGLFGSIYGYTGNQTSGGTHVFKQGGAALNYRHTFAPSRNYGLGVGWISNVADSQGQQNNGVGSNTTQFGGFAVTTATSVDNNLLVHRVDGIDAHGHVQLGAINFAGEYITALERYSPLDLTFNTVAGSPLVGAEPAAMHAEMDYVLPFFAKKYGTTLGFAYGHTWEALAMNLPENSYSTFLSTSIWRETTEEIEYRHDTDYAASDFAFGRGATTSLLGTGKGRNSIIVQFGVYF